MRASSPFSRYLTSKARYLPPYISEETSIRREKGDSFNALVQAKKSVTLNPYHRRNLSVLHACVESNRKGSGTNKLVVLIISCEKYQDRCEGLYDLLTSHGFCVKVVFGKDAQMKHSYNTIIVEAGDPYEDLAFKVRDAFLYVFEEYSTGTGILKIDDDICVSDPPALLEQIYKVLGNEHIQYGGRILRGGKSGVFRDWHFKKCSAAEWNRRPFGKKGIDRWAWGPFYYVSASALRSFYEFNIMFPDEIIGEINEDLYVGRVLSEMGIEPTDLDLSKFGITWDALPGDLETRRIWPVQ